MSRRGEFDLIAQSLAPLSDAARGLGLTDDAALFDPAPGHTVVLSTDTLVAGVHFLPDDPPGDIARKALRVNLSDIAAMGAIPKGYLLNLSLPDEVTDTWLDAFIAGLAADQHVFGVTLLGGDTVRTSGPFSVSVTAVGEVRLGRAIRRAGARVGDVVFVTGTIGDAVIGMRVLTEKTSLDPADAKFVLDRYRLPQPRTTFGPPLVGLASAAIDVSDGLIADLGHICETSSVAATISAAAVPFSTAVRAAIAAGQLTVSQAVGGGDDYELLFCAPPEARDALGRLSATLDVQITEIGKIIAGAGVELIDGDGETVAIDRPGHTHF
jgi:thiamine-monophosphate kinase